MALRMRSAVQKARGLVLCGRRGGVGRGRGGGTAPTARRRRLRPGRGRR
ncbi:hypothetical protein LT493_00665 [Streptomyces tricolor]|nr:hypothetical protein [Streptomyces tricolor]